MAGKAELVDRRGSISQKARLERGIAPGAGDDRGPALGSDLVSIHFDPGVDRGGIDQPLLRKQAFQRLRSQGRLRRQMRVQFLMDMGDYFWGEAPPGASFFG